MSRGKKVISDDENSHKENDDLTTAPPSKSRSKTKTNVASGSRTKSARVNSSRGQNARKAANGDNQTEETLSADEEQDEKNDDDAEQEQEEEGSPNGRKRARLNENGDSVAVAVKDEKVKAQRVHLTRDKDGYVPGSIVRIQLKNFVTYDFVEFRPGSSLNMIFGPNGTGKSTIACAICIGLGGSPALLGRSTELNAFVKQGYDSGYVELELKGKIGTRNLVIRRSINSKNRSSQYTLNGANATGREISERLAELNVQVSNLCSFLPQDRVSEFAQMTPQELLKETQRTAGDPNLTTWHTLLVEKGKEAAGMTKVLEDDEKRLANLEEKQKVLEKDVKRYNERREIEKQIEVLNVILPYVEYKESKTVYDETKMDRDIRGREYKEAEARNKPLKDFKDELKMKNDQLDKQRTELKEKIKNQYTRTVASIKERTKAAASRAEEALDRIKAIKRQERDRLKNIAKAKEEIEKLQEKVDNPPKHEDIEPIKAAIREISSTITDLKAKRLGLNHAVQDVVDKTMRNKADLERKERELRSLEDYTNAKVQALEKWDRDCAEVVKWILTHKANNEFAARIDLPAIIGASVKDQRYASAVEACFSASQMKTFIVRDENDYRQFNRLFVDTHDGIGRKARVTVWYRPRNEASLVPPPLSPQEMQNLGFDGYAIDFLECSEGLRWYFMKELFMHRTPIASRSVDDVTTQSLLVRPGPNNQPAPGAIYIAGNTLANVSRSAYGQRKVMTVTRGLAPARSFVHPSVDPQVKSRIEREMNMLRQAIKEYQDQSTRLAEEDKKYLDEITKRKPEHDKWTARQQAVEKAIVEIKTNETKLATWKSKLVDFEKQPSPDKDRAKQKAIVEETVKDRSKIVRELNTLVQEVIKKQSTLAKYSLRKIRASADLEAIDALSEERDATITQKKQAYEEAKKLFNDAKEKSGEKLAIVREKLQSLDDDLRARFQELDRVNQTKDPEDQWTSEKIGATLEMEQAKLELNHATDAGVIATYEAREREINSLREEHEKRLRSYKKLEEKIQITRNQWYPALTDLVSAVGEKFSAAFDRIGCAGEIRISEQEDYDKWSIDIFVKFRNEEPLTQLTGQRQSGGERSLTTIMYLMSLTEHARAPFSLVDEINQGMDQRYERAVHDQLVKVTCHPDSGQYFLITPKLLPFLAYHANMKILCVNNGEWLPESTSSGVGNMKQMIDRVAQRRAGPTAA